MNSLTICEALIRMHLNTIFPVNFDKCLQYVVHKEGNKQVEQKSLSLEAK